MPTFKAPMVRVDINIYSSDEFQGGFQGQYPPEDAGPTTKAKIPEGIITTVRRFTGKDVEVIPPWWGGKRYRIMVGREEVGEAWPSE